jgi:ketosteroid isomerase-like protein
MKLTLLAALFTFLTLHTTTGLADINVEATHKDIDTTVWKAFQDAFQALDGKALNDVYADKVLRITTDGIDTQSKFKEANVTRFSENIKNGDRIALDFWLDSRQTNETTSYEVGFYRMAITTSGGEKNTFYGQFHIVLKNVSGRWKIAQDWDTSSIGGNPITAADFARKVPDQF